ncbi:hypothetical protein PVAP13_1NG434000 [Panicum virgatum]|uniref:DUF6598 domain-containing protein n=1 Tax=Panicum virgatum TaxID=38727 RepID=A0A8T0X722_PANVG|nr:hypothetical protein PVAP13_1NG434000 [Panicum virgatum]
MSLNPTLAISDRMYFEFHLKIKGDEDVDEDFSKGYLVHSAICHWKQPMTNSLDNGLNTLELVNALVPYAVRSQFLEGAI